jgi:dolichyl-phosphate beta-glucosyltransferase
MKDVLIIPFYNEQKRYSEEFVTSNLLGINIDIFFVDDGSTDTTPHELNQLIQRLKFLKPNISFTILTLKVNSGKSNAIRLGLMRAQELGYEFALVQDFDFPYSFEDGEKALSVAKKYNYLITSGARVMLAGHRVNRFWYRQWIGRIIATLLSSIIPVVFYDLQSPCKVYSLVKIIPFLQNEFKTRWFHDAELLFRIKGKCNVHVFEFPLTSWNDVPNSSLKFHSFFRILKEVTFLLVISYRYSSQKFSSKFDF